jgi:hypothetical protein
MTDLNAFPGNAALSGSAWSAPHQPAHLSGENRGRGRQNENLSPHRQSPKAPEPAPESRCRPPHPACLKTWWCVFIQVLPRLGFEKSGQAVFPDAGRCPRAHGSERAAEDIRM